MKTSTLLALLAAAGFVLLKKKPTAAAVAQAPTYSAPVNAAVLQQMPVDHRYIPQEIQQVAPVTTRPEPPPPAPVAPKPSLPQASIIWEQPDLAHGGTMLMAMLPDGKVVKVDEYLSSQVQAQTQTNQAAALQAVTSSPITTQSGAQVSSYTQAMSIAPEGSVQRLVTLPTGQSISYGGTISNPALTVSTATAAMERYAPGSDLYNHYAVTKAVAESML